VEEEDGGDGDDGEEHSDGDLSGGDLGLIVGGVIGRDWLWLLLCSLRSSSSQRCFRVLFARGGAIWEQAWAGGNGGAGRCGRGGCVLASGSVWALVERVAGLLRFL
jgi:hypothetical protein